MKYLTRILSACAVMLSLAATGCLPIEAACTLGGCESATNWLKADTERMQIESTQKKCKEAKAQGRPMTLVVNKGPLEGYSCQQVLQIKLPQ
jgi:hypothetical protein